MGLSEGITELPSPMNNRQFELTRALGWASAILNDLSDSFFEACKRLVRGDLSAEMCLQRFVGLALDRHGGIVCAPLDCMKESTPLPSDEGCLASIRQGIGKIVEGVGLLCSVCGIGKGYLHRFSIRHETVFTSDFFVTHRPGFPCDRVERRAEYRRRILERICATVRSFWSWLRVLICRTARIVAHRPESVSAPRPYRPCRAMMHLVAVADRTMGLVALYGEGGAVAEVFLIGRERQKAWDVIRLLVEECDSEGCVRLPRLYASCFQTKDAAGDTIEDDLARFCRHVIPVGNGRYRLSRETKEPLVRDK